MYFVPCIHLCVAEYNFNFVNFDSDTTFILLLVCVKRDDNGDEEKHRVVKGREIGIQFPPICERPLFVPVGYHEQHRDVHSVLVRGQFPGCESDLGRLLHRNSGGGQEENADNLQKDSKRDVRRRGRVGGEVWREALCFLR